MEIGWAILIVLVGIVCAASLILYIAIKIEDNNREITTKDKGSAASLKVQSITTNPIDIFTLQKQVDELNAKRKYIEVIDYASSSNNYKTYHYFKLEDGFILTFTSTFCYSKYDKYYAFKEFEIENHKITYNWHICYSRDYPNDTRRYMFTLL